MRHILSANQFDKDTLGDIFERADFFKSQIEEGQRRSLASRHLVRQLVTLFYEPSTRTRLSFESAGARLGMGVVSTENAAEFSSAAKGESIEDTVRVVNGYGDVIVMRHPEPNSVARAAAVSEKPVINAGDGGNEHPTQAALDTYTINGLQGRLDELTVAFGGDLRFGRTVRSLVNILSRVFEKNRFVFIAPPPLQISPDITADLDAKGIDYLITEDRNEGVAEADVVYWTRLQQERLKDSEDVEVVRRAVASGGYILDPTSLTFMKETAIIMHPLPRVGEIDPDIDDDPRARYIEQAHNGVPVRQALLDMVLSDEQAA